MKISDFKLHQTGKFVGYSSKIKSNLYLLLQTLKLFPGIVLIKYKKLHNAPVPENTLQSEKLPDITDHKAN